MKNLRVLIVDDMESDRELATTILRQQGHEVLIANNGTEGVSIAEKEQPDLILMDVVMPEVNGFQATRELQCNDATREIPVIVVSWKDEEIDKVWAKKQGARAYLTKGYDKDTLMAAIEEVLKQSGRENDRAVQ